LEDFIRVLTVVFAALFPVVNPIGNAPIFLALTQRYPPTTQRVLAGKVAVYCFALLAASFMCGSVILEFFGISLHVAQIAGGLVVAATAWKLLNQEEDVPAGDGAAPTLDDALQRAFYPLTLPITVGPGSISIAITLGADLRAIARPGLAQGYPRHFIAALLGMAILCGLILISYAGAARIERLLGRSGTQVLVRLSALILLAIGVQIVWNGLAAGLPQIFGAGAAH
jgi:multiple antibiotic resistance protein